MHGTVANQIYLISLHKVGGTEIMHVILAQGSPPPVNFPLLCQKNDKTLELNAEEVSSQNVVP